MTQTSRAARAYTQRIQWHSMPGELEAPQQVEQPVETRPDLLKLDSPKTPLSDGVPVQNLAPAYLYQRPPARLRDTDERKKRNWLVLQVMEQREKEKDGAAQKEPRWESGKSVGEDTGWGWLATAVLREQTVREEEADGQEEEPATSILATEALRQKTAASPSGLMVNPAPASSPLAPAAALPPMLDAQEKEVMNRVAIDEGRGAPLPGPNSREIGTAGSDVRPDNPGVSSLSDLAAAPVFTTDPMKGMGATASGNLLPKTAALLSRHAPTEDSRPSPGAASLPSLFQAARPTSAFDLSMPSASVSGSEFTRPSSSPGFSSGGEGFFSAPRESSLGLGASRPAGGGLWSPSASPAGGLAPVRSTLRTEQSAISTPSFPTAPSWRR